ncbi:phosphotransferase [Devosia sp. RR2S18]|uniref:phosphotransferase n=1 Tax=Devosia rhizosphaerae TaxID=3049774 RepID=UPI0032EE7C5F
MASAQGEWLVEPLNVGPLLSKAPSSTRRAFLVEVFCRIDRSAKRELDTLQRNNWFNEIALLSADRAWAFNFSEAAMILTSASSSLIHGDLWGENVVVSGQGPKLIDFDKVSIAPTFVDPLTMILLEARMRRSDLLTDYLAGTYDRYLSRLYSSSTVASAEQLRRVSFMGWLAWARSLGWIDQRSLVRFQALYGSCFRPTLRQR